MSTGMYSEPPLLPVRCWTCRKVIANLGEKYFKLTRSGVSTKDALTQCGLRRACCRTQLLTAVDVTPRAEMYVGKNYDPKAIMTARL